MRRRPLSVTIFGILNICFALFGVLSLLATALFSGPPTTIPAQTNAPHASTNVSQTNGTSNPATFDFHAIAGSFSTPAYDAWEKIDRPLGGAFCLVEVAGGIGLLLLRIWGRSLSIICAVYGIIAGVISCLAMLGGNATIIIKVGIVLGCCIGLIYPVLLLIFMFRPNVVAAFKAPPPLA